MTKSHYSREVIQGIHDRDIGYGGAGQYCNKKLIERRKQHDKFNQLLDYIKECQEQSRQRSQKPPAN